MNKVSEQVHSRSAVLRMFEVLAQPGAIAEFRMVVLPLAFWISSSMVVKGGR